MVFVPTTDASPDDGSNAQAISVEPRMRLLFTQGHISEALTLGVLEYEAGWRRGLLGILRAPACVDEVLGMTLCRLSAAFPGFRWESSFRTWAYAIARRIAFRYQKSRRRFVLSESVPDGEQPARPGTSPWLVTENKKILRGLVERLGPVDRLVLRLRLDQHASHSEVAEALGMPENTARQRYHRAVARLMKLAQREKGWLASSSGVAFERDRPTP